MTTLRLKTVWLEEFRSFATGRLDLSADVVAIYGRNGAGKTTVFDALDFALFGSISRLDSFSSETDFIGRVGGTVNPKVRVEFQRGAEALWTETFWDRTLQRALSIDGSGGWRTHRDLLYDLLVDEEQLAGRRDVASVREMFRATVFLSQYSIRDFIESDAEERARTLARLAGLAHIQRARDKTDRVAALVERDLRALTADLQVQQDRAKEIRLAVAEVHLRRDALAARLSGSRPTVADAIAILSKAGVNAGASLRLAEDPAGLVRTLRVHCDRLSSELDSRRRRLAVVESSIPNQGVRVNRVRELRDRRTQQQEVLDALDLQHRELLPQTVATAKHLAESDARARLASESLQRVRAQAELWRESRALGTRLAREREALGALKKSLEAMVFPLQVRREEHELTRRAADDAAGMIELVRQEVMALTRVSENLPRHAELVSQQLLTRTEMQSAEVALAETEASVLHTREAIRTVTSSVASIESQLSHARVESEERAQLLSRLRSMAHGRECPLCGKEHASEAQLLQAIDDELSHVSESTKRLSAQLQSDRTVLAEASRNLTVNQARLGELTARITGLRNTLDRCEHDKRAIESAAALLEIDISEPAVRARLATARLREQEIGVELRTVTTLAAQQHREIVSADEEYRGVEERVSEGERAISQLEDLDRDIQRRLATFGHGLGAYGPTPAALDEDIARLGAALSQAERDQAVAQAGHREADERLQTNERRLAGGARALRALDDETEALAADIESFRSRCRDAGFEGEPTADTVRLLRATLDLQATAIREAKEMADRAELFLSFDALLPECVSQENELEAAERAVSTDIDRLNAMLRAQTVVQSWVQPLDTGLDTAIERTIFSHQQEIERHFKAMVPAPHLFDSIAMRKVDSRLQLGIRYRGQSIDSGEPRMFLSNAQLNLLALAIFLSLGARQQWSHLDTLLLDDPIQHLDDLDAIAFLDTLRAVALGRFGRRRQIVISTCDRNLFQLMIQKFQPLEAVGASFSAITLVERGSAGPVVRQQGPRSADRSSRSA